MGNENISDVEIRKWHSEGWRFYKRNKKGRVYITRRKGPINEYSLGPFNQELWDIITKVVNGEVPLVIKESESIFYHTINIYRLIHYTKNCLHIDNEGYCTYWQFKPNSILINHPKNTRYKEVKEENKTYWIFQVTRKYCLNCNAFISARMKTVMP